MGKLLALAIAFGLLVPPMYPAETKRSSAVRASFMKVHPCPATGKSKGKCPGWIIDHIYPLACGGPDKVQNLQWQTIAAAKAKDRYERKQCGK